mmetsp:Transcript_22526/g.49239  ORF Transcript_22526/g.49239 Transcript_22526/m.49239 type:complete len:910 (+) Transcript_22526:147-2876(+)
MLFLPGQYSRGLVRSQVAHSSANVKRTSLDWRCPPSAAAAAATEGTPISSFARQSLDWPSYVTGGAVPSVASLLGLHPQVPGSSRLVTASASQAEATAGGCLSDVTPAIETQVTRHNFAQTLPEIRDALNQCTFYAWDCEMTGLSTDPPGLEEYYDDVPDRYQRILSSAQQFLVIQFGLSAFKWDPITGGYTARTFNFYIWPKPFDTFDRRFLCQASSLDFLASQGFDFNKLIRDGIPFLPIQVRDRKLQELGIQPDDKSLLSADPAGASTASPPNEAEQHLLDEVRQQVLDWLSSTEQQQLQLPPCNARERTLIRALLRELQQNSDYHGFVVADGLHLCSNDSPSTSTDGATTAAPVAPVSPSSSSGLPLAALVLKRDTSSSSGSSGTPGSAAAAAMNEARARDVRSAAAFSSVLELMRSCGKPAVGHNASLDLALTLQQFVEPLPKAWPAFKALANRWFPNGIFDTKHIAVSLGSSDLASRPDLLGDTSLSGLFRALMPGGPIESFLAQRMGSASGMLPAVAHTPGSREYEMADVLSPLAAATGVGMKAHEAGYDAYMTGSVFAKLMRVAEIMALPAGSPLPPLAVVKAEVPVCVPVPVVQEEEEEGDSSAFVCLQGPGDLAKQSGLQPMQPPQLRTVAGYAGQIHAMRSDLPCLDLTGTDAVPSRPNVFHVSGIRLGMKVPEVLAKFEAAGLGRVRVALLPVPPQAQQGGAGAGPSSQQQQQYGGGNGSRPVYRSAFVEVLKPEFAGRVIPALRALNLPWRVVKYADFYYNRREAHGQQGGAGAGPAHSQAAAAQQNAQRGGQQNVDRSAGRNRRLSRSPTSSNLQQQPQQQTHSTSPAPATGSSPQQQQQQQRQAGGAGRPEGGIRQAGPAPGGAAGQGGGSGAAGPAGAAGDRFQGRGYRLGGN